MYGAHFAKFEKLTGISIKLTIRLVWRSPSIPWSKTNITNRPIIHATEAGNETELSDIRECTPKQTARIQVTPKGTYSHAVTARSQDDFATSNNSQ